MDSQKAQGKPTVIWGERILFSWLQLLSIKPQLLLSVYNNLTGIRAARWTGVKMVWKRTHILRSTSLLCGNSSCESQADVQHTVVLNFKVQVWFTSKQQRRHRVSKSEDTLGCRARLCLKQARTAQVNRRFRNGKNCTDLTGMPRSQVWRVSHCQLDFNPQISLQQNRYLNSSETFLLEDSVVVPFLTISSSSSEAHTCINVWDFR